MEEMLPFLAGLAYMAYKFYSNFQKEQEKARKRDPSQPYSEVPRDTYKEWFEPEPEPVYIPTPAGTHPPVAERYHEPKYEPAYKDPVIEKSVREPLYRETINRAPVRSDLKNPEVPAEEVVRNRAIHKPHLHKFEASHEEETLYSDFDFRDAIIKEAILNRPQY